MNIVKSVLFLWLSYSIFTMSLSCDSLSGNSVKERELFSKIKPGMDEYEVIGILGQPDSRVSNSDSTGIYYYFFSKNKSGLRSEMPYVLFDTTNKVKFATYGEGG